MSQTKAHWHKFTSTWSQLYIEVTSKEALGKIGGESVVASLIEALKDEHEAEDARVSAAYALGEIGEDRAAPLIEALKYEIGDVH